MTIALQSTLSPLKTGPPDVRTPPRGRAPSRTAAADWETIQACQRGNRRAWDTLFRRYEPTVYRFAFSLCQNHNDTADIAAQVFIRLYEKIQNFRNDAPFTSWLYRIAFHAYIDTCVRDPHRHDLSLDERQRHHGRQELLDLADPAPSPEDCFLQRESDACVNRALHYLPNTQRTMIELYHKDHRTYEEIAALMGLPIGTVKSRLARARRMLRERLSE